KASIGGGPTFTNQGGTVTGASGGLIEFRDMAASNGASLINKHGAAGAGGGVINFFDSSTGVTNIINDGADVAGGGAASVHLYSSSNLEGGGATANAGSNGGDGALIEYNDDSTGGSIDVYGNAVLDLTNHDPATPVTITGIQ